MLKCQDLLPLRVASLSLALTLGRVRMASSFMAEARPSYIMNQTSISSMLVSMSSVTLIDLQTTTGGR